MVREQTPSAKSLRAAAAEAVTPAAKNFGKEIAPVGSEAGKLIRSAAHTLMRPAFGIVWGADKIMDWFEASVAKRVDKIPDEDRKEADIRIAGPALEAVRFLENEKEIQEIFAAIISKSMDKREVNNIHSSFIEIAKQLDPLDAELFKLIAKNDSIPVGKWKWENRNSQILCNEILSQVRLKNDRYKTTHIIRSFENLSRLKLLDIHFNAHLIDDSHYSFFENDENKIPDIASPEDGYQLVQERGYASVTRLGRAFYSIVAT